MTPEQQSVSDCGLEILKMLMALLAALVILAIVAIGIDAILTWIISPPKTLAQCVLSDLRYAWGLLHRIW